MQAHKIDNFLPAFQTPHFGQNIHKSGAKWWFLFELKTSTFKINPEFGNTLINDRLLGGMYYGNITQFFTDYFSFNDLRPI